MRSVRSVVWLSLVLSVASAQGATLLDLAGSRSRIDATARDLFATDEGVAREAEVRLGCAGPRALVALDRLDESRLRLAEARLGRVLDLALRLTITEADLLKHPRLHRFVRPKLEEAERIADSLASFRRVGDLFVDREQGGGASNDGDRQLVALGGSAVPAAVRLLRANRPLARALGLLVIERLGAAVALANLDSLRADPALVQIWHDDYGTTDSIGAWARKLGGELRSRWQGRFRYEVPIELVERDPSTYGDLIYSLRSASYEPWEDARTGRPAGSWDEWWDRVRPCWQDWWRRMGSGQPPPDRETLLNIGRAYRGFQLYRSPARADSTILAIDGPPGTFVRVEISGWRGVARTDTTEILAGTVPLRFAVSRDSALAMGWVQRNEGEDDMGLPGTTRIRARYTSGVEWDQAFVNFGGKYWRLEVVVPPPRTARLAPQRGRRAGR